MIGSPGRTLRVLVLARAYPNNLLENFGLWTERPTVGVAERCDVRVVSPVPYCPPLPAVGPLREYTRFRQIGVREVRRGIEVLRPRFVVGPGRSLHRLEARAYHSGIRRSVDRLRETFPFDLVHAHFMYPDGVVAARLSRRYGVPFVVTEHAPWVNPRVMRVAVPAAQEAASLMVPSRHVRDTVMRFARGSVRVRVVPVGVDEQLFRLLDPREQREDDRILYVGLIRPVKGIDVLLEAMRLLKGRGKPGRLLLVGGSFYRRTRLHDERLRSLATEIGVDDVVTFAGPLPQEEVARLMRRSAVVVLPSRAESFGAVLVEALASGTPVVATRCGGPEDIVNDDVGVLVEKEDPRALADAISSILDGRRRFDPVALRAYAVERFSWSRHVDQVYEAYLDAVTGEGAHEMSRLRSALAREPNGEPA